MGFGLSILAAKLAVSACGTGGDTVVMMQVGTAGYAGGVYTPGVAGALNLTALGTTGCSDTALTIHLRSPLLDTITFDGPIKVARTNGNNGRITRFVGEVGSSAPYRPLTLIERSPPNLNGGTAYLFDATSPMQLSGLILVRNTTTAALTAPSVMLAGGKGSIISDCRFWIQNAKGAAAPASIEVRTDSVLIERNLFRSPANDTGRSIGVYVSSSGQKVEIRSNLFNNTGVDVGAGTLHLFANTFVGTRNKYSPILIETGVVATDSIRIQHNLFAVKNDSLPAVNFRGSVASDTNIRNNAWTRTRTPPFAGSGTGPTFTPVSTGTGINLLLSKGYSNYGTAVALPDYPLPQIRTDPLLSPSDSLFGKVAGIFSGNPTVIPEVQLGLTNSKLYFAVPNFTPFTAGTSWSNGNRIKVGALANVDNSVQRPSPLKSGTSLAFSPSAANPAQINMTTRLFDTLYYGTLTPPSTQGFFFSPTRANLTADDSAALKTATGGAYAFVNYTGANDSLLLPRTVRTGPAAGDTGTLYVKMLHYRDLVGSLGRIQAVINDANAVIATVNGVRGYPVNTLSLNLVDASQVATGRITFSVTLGTEVVDSVIVRMLDQSNAVQSAFTQRHAANQLTFSFAGIPRGTFHFEALPLGLNRTGTTRAQATSTDYTFLATSGSSVFLQVRACGGQGNSGNRTDPFCSLDSAMAYLDTLSGGGTLLIMPGGAIVHGVIGASSAGSLTILPDSTSLGPVFPLARPVFQGTTASALTLSRSNVVIRGMVFEAAPGLAAPAVSIPAGTNNISLEGNLFRVSSKTGLALANTGLNLSVVQGNVSHNVFWGFANGIGVGNASATCWITQNTFINDAAFTGAAQAAAIAPSVAVNTRIYHNFFSGYSAPFSAAFAGGTPVLYGNVFTDTLTASLLRGHTEGNPLDMANSLASLDLSGTGYQTLGTTGAFAGLEVCNQFVECSPLYAGATLASPPSGFPTPRIDFFGKVRVNRPEVGAYEFQNAGGGVLGRMHFTASGSITNYAEANLDISSKNIDTVDADSVYAWWSLNASDNYGAAQTSQKKSFAASQLLSGNIPYLAGGLQPDQKYYFHAQLFRAAASFGYPYPSQVTTNSLVTSDSCVLASANPANVCPSNSGVKGVFIDTNAGPYRLQYKSLVVFSSMSPGTGSVQPPRYLAPSDAASRLKGITPDAGLPMIRVDVRSDSLGRALSEQSYSVFIEPSSGTFSLAQFQGLDLFILPANSSGVPAYVSSWYLDTLDAGKVKLVVDLDQAGPFDLVFGKMSGTPGTVIQSPHSVPYFDHTSGSSDPQVFSSWTFSGSGFLTSNPVLLAIPVPAGGVVSGPVVSSAYPAKGQMLSGGFLNLGPNLKLSRAHEYYKRIVAADTGTTGVSAADRKPFTLNAVATPAAYASAIGIDTLSPSAVLPQFLIRKAWKGLDRTSRSIEVVLMVFDGGKIRRSRAFLQSKFDDLDLGPNDRPIQFPQSQWNLYTYPWDEAAGGSLARLVEATSFSDPQQKVMRYVGGTGDAAYEKITSQNFASLELDGGHAFWSGNTAKAYKPKANLGATTLDTQALVLPLLGGRYNDFGTPFNFSVKLRDVFDSSGIAAGGLVVWRYNQGANGGANGPWTALSDRDSVLRPWQGYTAKPSSDLSLRFPILDSARSLTPVPKTANPVVWEAQVWVSDARSIAELRVGKGAQTRFIEEAPLLPGQTFRVGFRADAGHRWSQVFETADKGLEGHWALDLRTGKGFSGVDIALHGLRGKASLYLVETLQRRAIPLRDSALRLTAGEVEQGDFHIVAGGAQYVEDFLSGVTGVYNLRLVNFPNPFLGQTSIRFSLPSTFRSVDYHVRIFDFAGRMVWEKAWKGDALLNQNWDGRSLSGQPLPAGQYHLMVEAQVPDKPVYKAQRKLIKLR